MEHLHGLSFASLKRKSWNEISMSEFFQIDKIRLDPELSELKKMVRVLTIVSVLSEEELSKINSNEIKDFYSIYLKWLNEPITGQLKEYYIINGRKYRRIDNYDKLSFGQSIDIEEIIKTSENDLDKSPKVLSVVLIPVKPLQPRQVLQNLFYNFLVSFKAGRRIASKFNLKYLHGEVEEYCETPASDTAHEIYNYLPITDAIAINVFFCTVAKAHLKALAIYSDLRMAQELISALTILEKLPKTKEVEDLIIKINTRLDGVGLFQLMSYQETVFLSGQK